MSPILTRPIREQLEHDRIIRQLQARYKRRHEVAVNPGAEQNQSVIVGELAVYPDLVLYSPDRAHRLEGTVEVETAESVHLLEARAEWGVFSKLNVPFHLYVPAQSLDTARRLCQEHEFAVSELWTYHQALDQVRFTQISRAPAAAVPAAARPAPPPKAARARPGPATRRGRGATRGARPAARKAAAKAAKTRSAKPARRAAPSAKASRSARPRARKRR